MADNAFPKFETPFHHIDDLALQFFIGCRYLGNGVMYLGVERIALGLHRLLPVL